MVNNLPHIKLNWMVACFGTFLLYSSALLIVISDFSGLLFSLGIIGFLLCIVGLVIFELLTFKENQSLHNMSYYIFGQFAIVVPFLCLSFINLTEKVTFSSFDIPILILFFACIWLNDTGAYLFGTAFGKHKMAPNISPKKSWEGFVGGVFLVTLITTLLWFFDILESKYIFYAIIICIAATVGDLLESVFKRRSGVKDSGKLLPGHGGILDRFDSVLLASPVLFLIIILLN